MKTIILTPEFEQWFASIKDKASKARLIARLKKAQHGNLGDVKSVGDGVFEMREFFGAGWRMYYAQRGSVIIIMLGGGDKSNQQADIAQAKRTLVNLED